MIRGCLALWLGICSLVAGQSYAPTREKVPTVAREFRGAWVACVYNIDWPSRKGLGAGTQQAEMRRILDKLVSLKMNAVIFQVRPQADALYSSRIEPWSPWLTGTMGRSPGYDPLAYCLQQAHARIIEMHAWFKTLKLEYTPYAAKMLERMDDIKGDGDGRLDFPEFFVSILNYCSLPHEILLAFSFRLFDTGDDTHYTHAPTHHYGDTTTTTTHTHTQHTHTTPH